MSHALVLDSADAVSRQSCAIFTPADGAVRGLANLPLKYIDPALESLDPYRNTFEQAAVGMVVADLDGRFLRVNRAYCELVGYEESELLSLRFQDISYPEDLEKDLSGVDDLLAGRAKSFRIEKRYIRKDGTLIWVQLNAGIVRTPTGEPSYLLGQVQDISARKEAELALEKTSRRLKSVLDAATQVSIISTDSQGIIKVFNTGAERMLGYSAQEMINLQTPQRFHLESEVIDRGEVLTRNFGRTIQGFDVFVEFARQGGHEEREWTYVRKNGSHLTVNLAVTAQRDAAGQVVGFLGIATDVTARKLAEAKLNELNQKLESLAATDELTQLPNRRMLAERLDALWNTSSRQRAPLSCIVLDIDHFKRINDTHGHLVGDRVLQVVSACLRDAVRGTDFCARYGGEEFVVVCPFTSGDKALDVAERIRESIAQRTADTDNGPIRVTVSLGVAERLPKDVDSQSLLHRADELLFEAKRSGRNCSRRG